MKKVGKKLISVGEKMLEFEEDYIESLGEVLQTTESEELKQGMSFGTKLIIISLILMLLIYAYVKFVKQGIPLINI